MEHLEAAHPGEPRDLAVALDSMGCLLGRSDRSDEAIPYLERALQLESWTETQRLETVLNLIAAYCVTLDLDKAKALCEEALSREAELHGPDTELAGELLGNL